MLLTCCKRLVRKQQQGHRQRNAQAAHYDRVSANTSPNVCIQASKCHQQPRHTQLLSPTFKPPCGRVTATIPPPGLGAWHNCSCTQTSLNMFLQHFAAAACPSMRRNCKQGHKMPEGWLAGQAPRGCEGLPVSQILVPRGVSCWFDCSGAAKQLLCCSTSSAFGAFAD